ncbi:DUF559 domain-containing protein [Pontibacter sp. 172403-2]|uniref:DUF559 domain-containing protein n=1 Tax=Pontibacter rufus TaxID=2791028 RepID=UPI0018AF6B7B|nr:DUF559 domain-containing protein [Pontibacter sp. 172403-2]MBF9252465.1 DUF559 domain-containing protein [Pontibacter sp. 172403-2]
MAIQKTEIITAEQARLILAGCGKAALKPRRKKTDAEKQLEQALQQHRIRELEKATGQQVIAEHDFHPERKWRFDFYLPESRIAIEVEGGAWTQGRHTRGKGFLDDCNKYNTAQVMGIRVLRFSPDQLLQPNALSIIKQAIQTKI